MILFFDSKCELCKRFKLALEKMDSQNLIEFKSIYDESIYKSYPFLSYEKCKKELHLIDEDVTYIGKTAVEHLIKVMPVVSKISWLIESNAGSKALDIFYNSLERLRSLSSEKCKGCQR